MVSFGYLPFWLGYTLYSKPMSVLETFEAGTKIGYWSLCTLGVMPRLDDGGEALLNARTDASRKAKRVWEDFADFLLSDNVLEVAVGLM